VISSGLGAGFAVLPDLAAYGGVGRPEKKPGNEKMRAKRSLSKTSLRKKKLEQKET
jgi:hypothetical protein